MLRIFNGEQQMEKNDRVKFEAILLEQAKRSLALALKEASPTEATLMKQEFDLSPRLWVARQRDLWRKNKQPDDLMLYPETVEAAYAEIMLKETIK